MRTAASTPAQRGVPSCGPKRRPHTAWQVLHGERSLYNARGGWDLARFLADADRDDVEAHLANLRCGCDKSGGIAAALLCGGGALHDMQNPSAAQAEFLLNTSKAEFPT